MHLITSVRIHCVYNTMLELVSNFLLALKFWNKLLFTCGLLLNWFSWTFGNVFIRLFTYVNLTYFLSFLSLLLLEFELEVTSFMFFTTQFLLWDTVPVLLHSFCFVSSVICICFILLIMYVKAASLYSMGWLEVLCITVSVSAGLW